ncbi:hypothetical protein [Bradyrhizobium sp. Tv2a-2]|uniref:hypothetical protein n=1 Tax=Bradyrhizobium sp. Tv2a-2 TaxID=113395 RepID=UPI000464D281|nr:hypothetical protein [Bradyrhizobium sp. Tv2a-2]
MVGSIRPSVETIGNADPELGGLDPALASDAAEEAQAWQRQLADGSKTVHPEEAATVQPEEAALEPETLPAEIANPLDPDVNASQNIRLEPLRRIPTPVGDGAGDPKPASFNLFDGKIGSELSNLLAEVATLAGVDQVGIVGESLFAVGGASQAQKVTKLLQSGSLQQTEELLDAGVQFVRGIGNVASGIAGIAGFSGHVAAGKASSGLWSFTEALNALKQAYHLIKAGKKLTPDQQVRVGEIIGSILKSVGAAASTRVPGPGPTITQVVGTGISIGSGFLNARNKNIDVSLTAKELYVNLKNLLGALQTPHGQSRSEPVSEQFNPDAHGTV